MLRLLLLVSLAGIGFAEPVVTKVEPPNWWPDQATNPVRMLIRGSGLTGAAVNAAPGFTATNVWVNAAGTYLLCDLQIPWRTKPGSYPLEIRTASGSTSAPFSIEAPLAADNRFAGFSPDDVIYLIMVDRFANGDMSNDDPPVSRGLFGRTNSHFYHGGDLQGIIEHLPYLKALGITAIWITPVYDNTNQPNVAQKAHGEPIADYHGYGTIDYYGLDEHLGSMETLRKLVDAAHADGIKVIQDQVANHVGPYHPWVKDAPKPSWFHGTSAQHVNETWQIWSLPDPHATNDTKSRVLDGWFQDVLPDMNQEDPDVARYEIQNALWWVGMAGFDGIRQDTLPYVPRPFWRRWSEALKRQYPHLRAVGEVFDENPAVPSFFQGGVRQFDGIDSGVDSVFDFPSMYAIRDVFAHGKSMDTLAKVLAQDRLYARPALLVPFLGNHDVKRFMSEPGANATQLELAFTCLLTMRGTPEIYYGDEIGMEGGDDPDNRRDFPGGWQGDAQNAFEAAARTPEQAAIFDSVQKLLALRKKLTPLRRGDFVDLGAADKTWAFARTSGPETVIVVFNNGGEAADVPVRYNKDGDYTHELETSA
ncbi:MAG: alpha-amylase family glycosyl hydrolase, partial [Bryobacteraceae bacterium]